jgi:hypothetical protein
MSKTFEKKWKMLQSHPVKQTPGIHLSVLDLNVGPPKLGHNTVKMASLPLLKFKVCIPEENLAPFPWGVSVLSAITA